ncbi:MAG: SGNH/GDSL hydrolase family protein [Candidatus Gastranaerophilales bacterium]|nr:SGNH/GDSL hydrolase family protein [Candidatus Gastranaerophilales bacterium]
MKKQRIIREMIYGIAALVCFGLLLWFTLARDVESPTRRDVSIVVFGDSIMGECRDETAITSQMQEILGQSVYNCALGGTTFSRIDTERMLGCTKDCMSMAAMTASVCSEDFAIQKAVKIREAATEYFEEAVEGLSEIDFNAVEVVFMQFGLNDYHGMARLTNEQQPYDEYSFAGAIRKTVRALQKSYPNLRIILVTPTYSWYTVNGLTCEEYNLGGGTLDLYVDTQLQVAEELGVEIIDVYHNFYPHDKWEDWELYTRDGLHPNEAGRALLAQTLSDYLLAHPKR